MSSVATAMPDRSYIACVRSTPLAPAPSSRWLIGPAAASTNGTATAIAASRQTVQRGGIAAIAASGKTAKTALARTSIA